MPNFQRVYIRYNVDPLQMPEQRGIALPAYFIKNLNAYYEGEWKNGFPQGVGKTYFENGSYY